jgi:hypothetical protein
MKATIKYMVFLVACTILIPNLLESRVKSAPEKTSDEKVSAPVQTGESKEAVSQTQNSKFPFVVYRDKGGKAPYIASGWMGDYGDIKINDGYKVNPKEGSTCVQVIYTAQRKNNAGWFGLYWQHPANNWGDKKGGFDLRGARKLTFWARGEKGGETIAEFKVGGITGQNFPGDTDSASIGPVRLSQQWEKYQIDLTGKDLSHIIGAFCLSASADDNPNGFTIYLDDVIFQ